MSLLEALILGFVQGLAEFLPISSSAHLKLARYFLQVQGENFQYFDLVCHSGTMLALVIFLRKDVLEVLKSPRKMAIFSIALIPLVPVYLALRWAEVRWEGGYFLGYGLLATALFLFLASWKKWGGQNGPQSEFSSDLSRLKWTDVVCIGMMQTLAFLPGISRSGSTIAAARFCGWSWIDAARFSFLLAIPTILGGELLETLKLMRMKSFAIDSISLPCYAAGFFASFGFGLIGIRAMLRIYQKGTIFPFILYLAMIGFLTLRMFHA